MTNTKTLMLAAVAALSLGIGTAMAEGDSAGGAEVISQPAFPGIAPVYHAAQPQAGSSDVGQYRAPVNPHQQDLIGGDGNG